MLVSISFVPTNLQLENSHSTKFDSLKSAFEKSQLLKITFVKYVLMNFASIHLQFSNIPVSYTHLRAHET